MTQQLIDRAGMRDDLLRMTERAWSNMRKALTAAAYAWNAEEYYSYRDRGDSWAAQFDDCRQLAAELREEGE